MHLLSLSLENILMSYQSVNALIENVIPAYHFEISAKVGLVDAGRIMDGYIRNYLCFVCD